MLGTLVSFHGIPHLGSDVRNRAFTLVELLIVIIIVAVLAAVAIPKYSQSWRRTTEVRMRAMLSLRRQAIQRFRLDTGLWPLTYQAVESLTPPSQGLDDQGNTTALVASTWRGPYLDNRLFSEAVIHSRYRGVGYSYKTTSPGVGDLRWNTSLTDLAGANIGAW